MTKFASRILAACHIPGADGFEVYEDNGGGLHIFALRGGSPVAMFTGLEFAGNRAIIDAEEFTGFDFDHDDLDALLAEIAEKDDLIADTSGIYPAKMGIAGKIAFGIPR